MVDTHRARGVPAVSTPPGRPDSSRSVAWRIVTHAAAPLIAYLAALAYGPRLIDDAYITFRYADNLATGNGLAFSPDEGILGTTSPLFALTLAGFRTVGAEIPHAARAIGMLSVMVAVMLVQRIAQRMTNPTAAMVIAVGAALHPDLAFTANSGMETATYMAAVYGTLLLSLQRREIGAAATAAVSCLLRPDGVVIGVIGAAIALRHRPRCALRFLVVFLLLVMPWLLYATVTYGSFVPHSVEAKRFIHAASLGSIVRLTGLRLSYDPQMKIIIAFAVLAIGMLLRRRSELFWIVVWAVLYLCGLCAAGVEPMFPWYVSPVFPVLMLLAGLLVFGTAERVHAAHWQRNVPRHRPSRWRPTNAATPTVLGIVAFATPVCWGLVGRAAWRRDVVDAAFGNRTDAYLHISEILRPRVALQDRVLVGEAGAIAFALPECRVLDSSGINSAEILGIRKADLKRALAAGSPNVSPEGTPEWILEVVRRYEPRFIVTYAPWLHMPTLIHDPRLTGSYRRLELPGLEHYYVLERATSAPPSPP